MPIDLPRPPEPTLSDLLAAIRQKIAATRIVVEPEQEKPARIEPVLLPNMPIPKSIDPGSLISIWPTMSRLAIAGGLGPELRLWTVCRFINKQRGGRDFVTVGEIIDATGWTRQTVARLIDASMGIFFRSMVGNGRGRRVWLLSQENVSRNVCSLAIAASLYDAREPERGRWQVTIDACNDSLGEFYAACFAGWIGTHKGFEYRITWDILQKAWSRSRTQLLEWIALGSVDKVNNRGVIQVSNDATEVDIYESLGLSVPYRLMMHNENRYAVYYRGNTYKANEHWRKVNSKGKGYKLNRLIDRAGVNGGDAMTSHDMTTAHDLRIAGSASPLSKVESSDPTRHNFTRFDAYMGAVRKRIGYLYFMVGQSRRGRLWEKTA